MNTNENNTKSYVYLCDCCGVLVCKDEPFCKSCLIEQPYLTEIEKAKPRRKRLEQI